MAKKKNNTKISEVLGGEFFDSKSFKENRWLIFEVIIFLILIIMANHKVSSQIATINDLKEQVEEYKSRNAYAQSKLIKVKMESELGKEVIKDSLIPLENHPHKLLIRIDDAKKK